MKQNENLIRLLNLNYLMLTNRTVSCGGMDLPAINCNVSVFPDYIALYSQKSLYHKTERTVVAFFQFDEDFDGKFGLYWAIYYNVEERLAYFKERFKGVKYVIIPDFSGLLIFIRLRITTGCSKVELSGFGSCLKSVRL